MSAVGGKADIADVLSNVRLSLKTDMQSRRSSASVRSNVEVVGIMTIAR